MIQIFIHCKSGLLIDQNKIVALWKNRANATIRLADSPVNLTIDLEDYEEIVKLMWDRRNNKCEMVKTP